MASRWMAHWGLVRDGPLRHGYCGVVLPVRQGKARLALKLTLVDEWSAHETHALRLWNGRGAVRLIDADGPAGALLLEWLDADRDLRTVPVGEALDVAGDLLGRLFVPAAPELGLPHFDVELNDAIQEIERGLAEVQESGKEPPIGIDASRRSLEWARAMLGGSYTRVVNVDLHYENVLAGSREPWLAIDPKVALAPVGFAFAPLLWNRTQEIQKEMGIRGAFVRLVDRAGADAEIARESTLLRCIAYLWWTQRAGASRPREVPQAIVSALAPSG